MVFNICAFNEFFNVAQRLYLRFTIMSWMKQFVYE